MNLPSETLIPDYSVVRATMVARQLRPNQIVDPRVLKAMGAVPREVFVPSTLVGVAYRDDHIPLISGRFLMQPWLLARLLQAVAIKEGERVLDLAPATGYSTVVMAELTDEVIGVEPDALLHDEAEKNISLYAGSRARILAGAPVEGCLEHAPFDVIFINGSVDFLPEMFFDQLGEGGRLIAVVRDSGEGASGLGCAQLYRKTGGIVQATTLFEAVVPPAPGFVSLSGFRF